MIGPLIVVLVAAVTVCFAVAGWVEDAQGNRERRHFYRRLRASANNYEKRYRGQ